MESLVAVSKGEHSKKTGLEREACSLQKEDRDKPARTLNSLHLVLIYYGYDFLFPRSSFLVA